MGSGKQYMHSINIGNSSDDVLKETAFARDGVKKFTDGHEVVKVIIVKDKLVNIVVK